jgi:ABC-type cobalamin/Fe3+-siderophores transport system ATPase subunit
MIERLYVHNFRCLENFTLDLAGRSSALAIGRNGSGKSTVMRCLDLFQSIGRSTYLVSDCISESDFTQHRVAHPMRFEIVLTINDKRFEYSVSFEWGANLGEAHINDESLKVDGTSIFTRDYSQIQVSGSAPFGIDWRFFALTVINERPGGPIQTIKKYFATMILIAPIPANMTGFTDNSSLELQHDAENYASCLRTLLAQKPAAYGVFAEHVKSVIPDFAAIENVERGENGTRLVVHFEQPQPRRRLSVEFQSLSDGEKCFFLSAYILAAYAEGAAAFCMWDEPDNHLSLSEVGQFVIGLRKMTNRGGQFIATTHHPETVRKFSDETTLVFSRKSHLDPTVVRPLADYTYTGDLINALIRDEIIG